LERGGGGGGREVRGNGGERRAEGRGRSGEGGKEEAKRGGRGWCEGVGKEGEKRGSIARGWEVMCNLPKGRSGVGKGVGENEEGEGV